MVRAKKWIIAEVPNGAVKTENFRLEEEDLPSIKDDEFLCETVFMNLRPSLRISILSQKAGDIVYSDQMAVVTESKNSEYPVGTKVILHLGWRSHSIIDPDTLAGKNPVYKAAKFDQVSRLMNVGSLSPSHSMGLFGTSGLCAYFGITEILDVKAGELVYVNAAAGGVGSIAGQIAMIRGATVVGSTSTDEKCQWLKSVGFKHSINYKSQNLDEELKKVAPDGFDCFLDNVGGSATCMVIIKHIKKFGRIALAGGSSTYEKFGSLEPDKMPNGPLIFNYMILKQLKIEGYVMDRWPEKMDEAFNQLRTWVEEGKIVAKEHVTEGFENIPRSFVDMMAGKNIGKSVVKISNLLDNVT